jgi:probable HAF family extracellular repeat protein
VDIMKWRNIFNNLFTTIIFLVLTLLNLLSFGQQSSFQGLGDLPGGEFHSHAYGVSPDGSTVVGLSIKDAITGNSEAFLWRDSTGMIGLGLLPGSYNSLAYDVSFNGYVVVGRCGFGATGSNQAFYWTESTGMVGLPDFHGFSFPTYCEARSGLADGTIAVGSGSRDVGGKAKPEACMWIQPESMTGLGYLPEGKAYSRAFAMASMDTVIVGDTLNSDSIYEAFRWTPSTGMVGLGGLPGGSHQDRDSHAYGVSADG